jgi:hypothetical protein
MTDKVHFDASVEAGHCCFCGKPLLNGSEETTRKQVTVETTTGSSSVFNYHEACFQEWLGKRETFQAHLPNQINGSSGGS